MVRDGHIVLHATDSETALIELAQVPVLKKGSDAVQTDSVLAAVAAAWALDVAPMLIRAGLATFEMKPGTTKEIV